MSLRVVKIAKNATLQDGGRFGYRHYGVPEAGPFDRLSAMLSNAAIGNQSECAVLELHAPGAVFEATESCRIAYYGASTNVHVNEIEVLEGNPALQLEKGSKLEFSNFRNGARLYVSIQGGFKGKEILGSTSGTVVEAGEVFQSSSLNAATGPKSPSPMWDFGVPIQIPFVQNGLTDFDFRWGGEVVVSHLSDRRGIRLIGDAEGHNIRHESRPICTGAVQWTPSGELIVIGPDGPTIGGYPWIGTIPKFALFRLGQVSMNDFVHLYPISWEQLDGERQKLLPGWNLTFKHQSQ